MHTNYKKSYAMHHKLKNWKIHTKQNYSPSKVWDKKSIQNKLTDNSRKSEYQRICFDSLSKRVAHWFFQFNLLSYTYILSSISTIFFMKSLFVFNFIVGVSSTSFNTMEFPRKYAYNAPNCSIFAKKLIRCFYFLDHIFSMIFWFRNHFRRRWL